EPSCFFLGPANEEAWASLSFVAAAQAGGCLLLGATGLGKTLHGRRLVRERGNTPAFWVDGLAPHAQGLTASMPNKPAHKPFAELCLLDLLVEPCFSMVIVDDAAALPIARWNELFHAVDRIEQHGGRVALIVLAERAPLEALAGPIRERLYRRCL